MAKKFVTVNGISNVFTSVANLQGSTFKSGVAAADANSILFMTANATDATTFATLGVVDGGKYIWAKGSLYNGNDTRFDSSTVVKSIGVSDDNVVDLTISPAGGKGDVTISASHATSGVTAGTYGSKTSNSSFSIPRVIVDAKGHITGATNLDVSVPAETYKAHEAISGATTTASGLYKFSTDGKGHVNSVTAVAKADITNLGIPGSDTNQTVKAGDTAFGANDAVGFVAGSNVTITPDVSKKTITIAASQPTVNNGKLTINVEGTKKAEFTANQSGNTSIDITAADLGLTNAMHFKGVVDSLPTPTTTDEYNNGDVIIVGTKEYVRSGKTSSAAGSWIELGDEGSHALKTISISGANGLTGGGDLSQNRTIKPNLTSYTTNSAAATKSTSTDGGLYAVELDKDNKLAVRVPWKDTDTKPNNSTITISAGAGLKTGGSFTLNQSGATTITLAHADVTTTGSTGTATLAHGGTFAAVIAVTTDNGHVTGYTTTTFTLPSAPSQSASYKTVTPANNAGVTAALTANTTAITAVGAGEAFTFEAANKWLTVAGSNSATGGSDVFKIAHAVVSGLPTTATGSASAATATRGVSITVPQVTADVAGHVTGLTTATTYYMSPETAAASDWGSI